ncbi:MAG TPA: argininosuccinate synthase, partial [Bacillota bacterium]|nr:argininosuccinate synthase [Bacillota bacterium]
YSRDQNIWHISHEGGNLENPWNEHLDDILVMSVPPEQAPDKPTFVDIDFEKGIPVGLN